jgi:molybdenum cofactor cytidylyltransferase
MPTALLPAAGASRRMGRPKLFLPYQGGTIVGSLVASLRAAGVERIVLVIAPGDEELRAWAEASGLIVAVNPEPERGMLSTIQEGLAALGPVSETLLISPADLPAALPVWRGRHGHPLAIAPELIPEIAGLDPAIGLRQLRDRHAAATLWIDVDDPGAVQDVDTPQDYEALT